MTIHIARDLKLVPIDTLTAYERNARTHSEEQVEQIAASIKEFGFTNPILVDGENGIIAGHGRLAAARKLKLREVPIVELKHLTPAQKRAYIIADNKLALNADWDLEILAGEIDRLKSEDFDLELLGFTEEELADLDFDEEEGPPGGDGEGEPLELREPKIVPGEIFILGGHRLMCGSATNFDDLGKLLNGNKIDLVLSDPPYGVAVVQGGKVGADFGIAKKGVYSEVIGDDTTDTAREFYQNCIAHKISKFIIWGGNYFTDFLEPSSSWVIWNKRGDTGIQNTFADAELAWSNIGFPSRVHNQLWNGFIREGEKEKRVHPTQKPVALAEFCLSLVADGNNVFDGFGGSGWCLMACEKLGRNCFMMELDPVYCAVIIDRWEKLTGMKAQREDGKSWSEIRG